MKPDHLKTASRLRLRVSAAAEAKLRAGHPWVFADSIREQNRTGKAGELGVVYDHRDQFLAIGLFDPESPIRLRVLHRGRPEVIDDAWWSARLTQAIDRRRGLFDERTTGYRWINGESDGWPGLVLDRYGTTLVLKLYTAAWLPRLDAVADLVRGRLRPARLVLRVSRNVQAQSEAHCDGEILFHEGPASEREAPAEFLENGIRFQADTVRGQKTGFFLDQRENRQWVESLAGDRTVLNAFSFSGGFSLYAARGGAVSVTDVDLSVHALAAAARNFALNAADKAIARCRREGVQADVFDWLAAESSRKFGLIVLDPPSFARREAERAGAIRAYEKLASLGIRRLAPGGVLLAASCSAHVSANEFFDAARRAATQSGRRFQELRTTQHAPDHPAAFPEAEYLKAIHLSFEDRKPRR